MSDADLFLKFLMELNQTNSLFWCPALECGRKYKRKGDLKSHVKAKHSEMAPEQISRNRSFREGKPFQCPYTNCESGFLMIRGLKRHLKQKHK